MITTSLELSKALKEAGWPQELSTFYFVNHDNEGFGLTVSATVPELFESACKRLRDYYGETHSIASPTAEEILEKLPPSITVDGKTLYLNISDDRDWIGDSSWDISYSVDRTLNPDIHVRNKDGFAGACAKMWLLLKKLNLL